MIPCSARGFALLGSTSTVMWEPGLGMPLNEEEEEDMMPMLRIWRIETECEGYRHLRAFKAALRKYLNKQSRIFTASSVLLGDVITDNKQMS